MIYTYNVTALDVYKFSTSNFVFTAAFKEICPAGPGYHYSASAVRINQRLAEMLDTGGPPLVSENGRTSTQVVVSQPESTRTHSTSSRIQQSTNTQTIRVQQPSISLSTRPQQPDANPQTGSVIIITQPNPNLSTGGGSQTTNARPQQPSSVRPGSAGTGTNQPVRGITRE